MRWLKKLLRGLLASTGARKGITRVLSMPKVSSGEREFPHSGAGLAALGDWLLLVVGEASAVAGSKYRTAPLSIR
jgi:hypothetical protein